MRTLREKSMRLYDRAEELEKEFPWIGRSEEVQAQIDRLEQRAEELWQEYRERKREMARAKARALFLK